MTKEEAIEIIIIMRSCIDRIEHSGERLKQANRLREAYDMAIEALSAEPTDLISRADAVKSLPNGTCYDSSGCVNALKNLPSAERPNIAYICDGTACDGACDECHHTTDIEHAKNFKCVGGKYIETDDRPSGEWEDKEVFNETNDDHIVDEWQSARCSVCGKYHTTPYMYYFEEYNFCPNCGAKMGGKHND